MIYSISSFEIFSVVIPGPYILFWIAASISDVVVFNSNGNKTLLINSVSTFFINGRPNFVNGTRILPKNPHS